MTRALFAPRDRGLVWSNVIASEAKQSILSLLGENGLLRFARNEGSSCLKFESEIAKAAGATWRRERKSRQGPLTRTRRALQQPRQMLLILRSSAASSLLTGLFGSLRFFSFGTSPARGWRWPTGAWGTPEPAVEFFG